MLFRSLNFIRGVLNRYAKQDGYFKRKGPSYYVIRLFDKQAFVERRNQMRVKVDCVLTKMQSYFMENFANERLPIQTLREMLGEFFERCGFEMAKDVDNLQLVTDTLYGKRVFWIARYILDAVGNHALEGDYLIEMVKGFLVSGALYFYQNNNKVSINSKLKNTVCYLDCSLVISCLGYNSEEQEREALELVHMIRKSGGTVRVFEHTVAEASSLLNAFASLPSHVNSFQLDGLASKKFTTEILLAVAASVGQNLKERLGIDTVPSPSYTNTENFIGVQDETAVVEWLESKRKTHVIHRERFEYDARSLSSIGMLRGRFHPERIEWCKAILVTQDPYLSWCMKALNPKRFPPEMDFVILDVDLASLLWLGNYNEKSSLPVDILIANATALNLASPEIMDRAIELTEQLVKTGDISEEAALTIRSAPKMKKYLGEETQNDMASLTHTSLKKALASYVDEVTEQVNDAALELQRELEAVKQENYRLREEQKQRIEDYTREVTRKATCFAHMVEQATVLFCSSVLVLSVVLWCAKLVWFQDPIWKWAFVVLDILSLLQILDYFCNPGSVTKKISRKLRDWAFTRYYSDSIANLEVRR